MKKSANIKAGATRTGESSRRGGSGQQLSASGKPVQKPVQSAGLGFLLCRTAHMFAGMDITQSDPQITLPDRPGPDMAPEKRRVLIVDAHPIIRRGIHHLISGSGDLTVCGEATHGDEAVTKAKQLRPDLVVVDLALPGKSGLGLLREIKLRCPNTGILVVSRYEENIYAQRVLRAGAMGYIMQREAEEKILMAIRRILDGQVYVSDRIAAGALRQFATEKPAKMRPTLEVLTDRELEVFRAIGEGKSIRDIARLLKLSTNTVAAHRGHIISKLGLSGSRKLFQMAIEQASENWSMHGDQISPGDSGNVPKTPSRGKKSKKGVLNYTRRPR